MNILILHMRFHPDLTGTGPLVTHLATDLAAMGDKVTIVTSMPHYGRSSLPSDYRGKILHRSTYEGVDVWRTAVYVPPTPSGFHRSINFLSYTCMSIVAGVLSGPQDVVLCVNPPITVGMSGWLVRVVRGIPMVFNVQDVWPDCLVIIGQLRNRWLIRAFDVLERWTYRVSDRVTVLSEGMRKNLLCKGVPAERLTIIPNWADSEHIRPTIKENGFRADHGLNGQFVAMFAGNLGYIANLEMVLDTAALLLDRPEIVFVIVGEGNAKAGLVASAQERGLTNVRFLPTQPVEVVPEMLGAADVSLVTLNSRLGQLNVPSKVYSIMASGRPVVAAVPDDSEVFRLVHEAGCGVTVRPDDPAGLARVLRVLLHQPALLAHYGAAGRTYVEHSVNRRLVTAMYRDVLHAVGENG